MFRKKKEQFSYHLFTTHCNVFAQYLPKGGVYCFVTEQVQWESFRSKTSELQNTNLSILSQDPLFPSPVIS